jgi:iron complex outermembrane receptor protein
MEVNRLWLLASSCLGLCLAPVVAQAQQPDGEQASSHPGTIEEIIVTAEKRSERLRDVPFTVIAVTPAQLQSAGVVSTRDLPSLVPGLVFTSVGPFVAPTMRGITTTASGLGQDAPIAIYIDGIYQPTQAGNSFSLPDISRIEVLKGPQGTLFGRNVVGGAILIHTRDPSFQPTGHFSISDGVYSGGSAKTANEVYVNAFVSGPLVADKIAFSLAGSVRSTPGYQTDDVNGARTGKSWDRYVRAKVLLQPTDTVKFVLSGMYDKSRDGVGAAYFPLDGATSANARNAAGGLIYPDRIIPTRPWHVAYEKEPVVTDETYGLSGRGDIETEAGTLTSLTAYYRVHPVVLTDFDAAYAPSCLPTFACLTYYINQTVKTFSQEADFASRRFGPVTFTVGANYYNSDGSSTSAVNSFPSLSTRVKTSAWAVYGEGSYEVTDRLTASAGLRYSSERKTLYGAPSGVPVFQQKASWDSLTPRASLRYRVSDAVNAYATFSKGFKSGVLDSSSPTPLGPEHLTSYEAGIKALTGKFSFNASAFYYDYKNIQISIFDTLTRTTILENAGQARIYGLDLDGAVQVAPDLQVRAGVAWLPSAKYTKFPDAVQFLPPLTAFGLSQTKINATGLRMIRSPRITGNVALDYKHETSMGRLTATSTLSYSSSYNWDPLGTVKTGAYATLSGQIGIQPTNSNLKISVFGRNLTNRASLVSVSPQTQTGVVFSPPRQVGISLDYDY